MHLGCTRSCLAWASRPLLGQQQQQRQPPQAAQLQQLLGQLTQQVRQQQLQQQQQVLQEAGSSSRVDCLAMAAYLAGQVAASTMQLQQGLQD
jgi:hypothetical protein